MNNRKNYKRYSLLRNKTERLLEILTVIGNVYQITNGTNSIGQRIARKLNKCEFISGEFDHLYNFYRKYRTWKNSWAKNF
jgi:hypothetical protein